MLKNVNIVYICVRNMNTYHLKYFIDAARLKSISKSAELNHVSHSAVSQGIKSLETFLDIKLMIHSKRLFQLTREGESFSIEGQKLLEALSMAKKNLHSKQKEVSGNLVIWAPQSLIVDSLCDALATYRKKYPKVNISLKTGAAALVRAAITNEEAHLGLLVDDGHLSSFSTAQVRTGEFVLVSKTKESIQKTSEVIVTSRDKIEVVHLRKRFKSKFKFEVKLAMEVMSWGVIKTLVHKRFGIGYVPDYCVWNELEAEKLFRVQTSWPAYQYRIEAIWPKQRQLHINGQLFLDLLTIA